VGGGRLVVVIRGGDGCDWNERNTYDLAVQYNILSISSLKVYEVDSKCHVNHFVYVA